MNDQVVFFDKWLHLRYFSKVNGAVHIKLAQQQ